MGQDKDHPEINFSSNTDKETGLLYPGAVASPSGVVNKFVNVQGNHSITAKAVARDAITLLKNENQTLPLRRSDSLKVFGTDAGPNTKGLNGCSDAGCDNGVLVSGWGSGSAQLPYLNTPQEGISNATENVDFYLTDSFPSDVNANPEDIALVFINSDSGENYITVEGNPGDRTLAGLNAWHKGDDLVKAAADEFSQVVVIIHSVGPILMEEWIDLEPVKAVLLAHLPGQEAGESLTDVLFGDYSPSGHLPYTIPRAESDYPSSTDLIDQPFGQIQDTFTEGLYIDYRHFNKANITPRFPFGHGLSYTTFNFTASISPVTHLDSEYPSARSNKGSTPTYNNTIPAASEVAWPKNFNRIWRYLYPYLDHPDSAADNQTKTYPYPSGYTTKEHPAPRAGGAEGGNPALWDVAFSVQVQVTNSGSRPGRAVPQLYVELPDSLDPEIPRLQLRQFDKTQILRPGQSETVSLDVTRKDLSVWDVVTQDWKAPVRAEGVKVWLGESVTAMHVSCEAGKSCSAV